MNATQLLPHFDRLAEAPNAVPRLRRFILDLAVRGKLVEQDAGDEPAAELLKRIQFERMKLVKAGKFREGKAPANILGDLPTNQLPINWSWVPFGATVNTHLGGGTPSKANSTYWNGEILWASVKDVGKTKYLDSTIDRITEAGLADSSSNLIEPGNLIVVTRMGLGKVSINRVPVAINQDLRALSLSSLMSIDYCYIYLKTHGFEGSGLTVKGIKIEELLGIAFPLPPLVEQHRIVAKVDELMALCDQLEAAQQERERRRDRLAAASLQRLNQPAADTTPEAQREHARFHLQHLPHLTTRPEHIKAMRQLLVNLAVVGKLAQPEPNDEPAEVLLKKVWAEKKSRGLLKQAKESPEGNIDLIVNSLPAGWAWTTFESFATEIATGPFGSALHQSDYIDGGIPLVNPSHMIDGRIFVNPKISVSEETAKSLASYRMKSGDVVMARRGEVGRAAIVTDAEAGWLCGTGSFFVNFHKEIDRQFVILLLRSDAVRRYLAGEAVGTTMVNLNHGILKRIPLALPPAAEQHRIVAKVDELMALCDQLEAQLTTTQTDSRRLLEAVLVAALVPV